ncbi:hypothetical protein [Streptomyces sp. SP18CS02]|uniref:hypothetical protein n=1 Tax=Streptomyces sp. SP18CS02 TaxID=3002531 RepID=UPI002E760786|nr:hypothetical protein [Streptomyces sp. SP18CS02]MEE1751679.1 hypothetical protein [Streptomyces sp. SP18CS02]
MGVLDWFRRKSKDSAKAPAEETATDTVTADPADFDPAASPASPAEASDTASAESAAEASETSDTAEAAEKAEPAVAEGVEIPKQQSAEEAADNEAGEGARK